MKWFFARFAVAMTCLSAVIAADLRTVRAEPHPSDPRVWQELRPARLAYQDGGSRRAFLETCQRLRTEFPGSRYDAQLDSLIAPLKHEHGLSVPAFLKKKPAQRTREEEIQFWIYQLRDLADQSIMKTSFATAPQLFSRGFSPPTPADRRVAIGPPAIPFLMWATPLAASRLSRVEMGGMRRVNEQLQSFSSADESIETFQNLTGKDFGYRREGPVEERLAAIGKARDWWEQEGRAQFANEIARDHPPAEKPGDLFLSDGDLLAMTHLIRGDNPELRTRTLASLGPVYSREIQRALAQARTLASRPTEPPAARETAVSVLIERRHITDEGLLHTLGRDPQLSHFKPVQQYLTQMTEQQQRWGPEKSPLE